MCHNAACRQANLNIKKAPRTSYSVFRTSTAKALLLPSFSLRLFRLLKNSPHLSPRRKTYNLVAHHHLHLAHSLLLIWKLWFIQIITNYSNCLSGLQLSVEINRWLWLCRRGVFISKTASQSFVLEQYANRKETKGPSMNTSSRITTCIERLATTISYLVCLHLGSEEEAATLLICLQCSAGLNGDYLPRIHLSEGNWQTKIVILRKVPWNSHANQLDRDMAAEW